MLPQLHISNTFFESELERPWTGKGNPLDILASLFNQNPVFLQLQFLPFLYAKEGEAILLSHLPSPDYADVRNRYGLPDLKMINLYNPSLTQPFQLVPWGYSQLLAAWAAEYNLEFAMPSWPVIQEVNSKAFSFQNSPKLAQAELLFNSQDAHRWLNNTSGKRVLKTCYGVSGRGHCHVGSDPKRITAFLEKQWQQQRPVIAEPWVDRVLDFSTQWNITQEKEIIFLGATRCFNTSTGQYRSTQVGNETILFGAHLLHFTHHKNIARQVLAKIADMGYFGPVGIDAMLYHNAKTQSVELHPVVEINARKTMGWVAIAFQQTHYPNTCIEFSFNSISEGLLPSFAVDKKGEQVSFERNIQIIDDS